VRDDKMAPERRGEMAPLRLSDVHLGIRKPP